MKYSRIHSLSLRTDRLRQVTSNLYLDRIARLNEDEVACYFNSDDSDKVYRFTLDNNTLKAIKEYEG